jgi:site-specific recombinase XerD
LHAGEKPDGGASGLAYRSGKRQSEFVLCPTDMSVNSSPSPSGVWFPARADAPQQEEQLAPSQRQQYRRAIVDWLRLCKQSRQWATVDSARQFMRQVEEQRQRGSASTQKQALNALVFLLREALAKPLADFSGFVRARKRLNIPVVLTREGCRRLVEALAGTTQLMAELMYGSGLRLMNVLETFNVELPTSNAQRCPA